MGISKSASSLLDLGRWLSAFYVVLHHLANKHEWRDYWFGELFAFGQEAVMIFFLMSGFVIYISECERLDDWRGYYYRRFRRIYPVLAFAMLVSVVVALWDGVFLAKFDALELLSTLLGLVDRPDLQPGVLVGPFMGNTPLWSLSYELFFYLVFPFAFHLKARSSVFARFVIGLCCLVCLVLCALLPNHFLRIASYFLIWWSGAMIGRAYMSGFRSCSFVRVEIGFLAAASIITFAVVVVVGFNGLGHYPFLTFRHFFVAVVMVVVFFGRFGQYLSSFALKLARPSAFLASISYGVYVLHYPVLIQWSVADDHFALAILILLAAAIFAERFIYRFVPRTLARNPSQRPNAGR